MANQHLLVVLMAFIVGHAATCSAANTNSTVDAAAATVYDVLEQKNLPRGLLPPGVKSYTLHAGGALEVTLPGECSFFVTSAGKQFKFRYGSRFGGIIKLGSITHMYGVRMQVEYEWLSQVERAGNQLKFLVETSVQSFPVSAFSQSPRCT